MHCLHTARIFKIITFGKHPMGPSVPTKLYAKAAHNQRLSVFLYWFRCWPFTELSDFQTVMIFLFGNGKRWDYNESPPACVLILAIGKWLRKCEMCERACVMEWITAESEVYDQYVTSWSSHARLSHTVHFQASQSENVICESWARQIFPSRLLGAPPGGFSRCVCVWGAVRQEKIRGSGGDGDVQWSRRQT